jgi:hypothetical protein
MMLKGVEHGLALGIDPGNMRDGRKLRHATRFASLFTHVYSASGYSTVWELAYNRAISKTFFIQLDRPLEDCGHRVMLATSWLASLGDDTTPEAVLRENHFNLQTVLRSLTSGTIDHNDY